MQQHISRQMHPLKQASSQQNNPIYGKQFAVDQITNPQSSFPKNFQPNKFQLTAYQQCCVSCGNMCLCCCVLWNVFTCTICNCCCNFYYTLPTSKAGIVQQYGRFTRLLQPGFNYINPCSQQVSEVDMKMQTASLGKQTVMTKDNIQVTVQAIVFYRIINPIKVKFGLGLGNIFMAIRQSSTSAIRNSIGQHTLDQILSTRSTFLQTSKSILQKQLSSQGLLIQHFFLTQIFLPAEIERNLTAAAKQKRLSQAQIINSQANIQAAKLMKQSSQLLNTKAAMQIRYLQMLQQISNQNKPMTLFIPIGVNKIGRVKN